MARDVTLRADGYCYILSCPPFEYSAYTQNNNKTANNNTEISIKQGFVEGRVIGAFRCRIVLAKRRQAVDGV